MGRPGSKIEGWRVDAVPVRSVADLDAAEAPVITIPEALANETAARGRTLPHTPGRHNKHRRGGGWPRWLRRRSRRRSVRQQWRHRGRAARSRGSQRAKAAIAATATKATNVFFMSWALLEMAPLGGAGFKVTHTPYSKTDRLAKKAHNSQSQVNVRQLLARKKVFSGQCQLRILKTCCFGKRRICWPICKEDERELAADPHVAESPAIAVPETLPLPDAAIAIVAGGGDIGRTAVITVAGPVVSGSVSIIIGARHAPPTMAPPISPPAMAAPR